ncbi:MAG: hypothetical protein J1F67_02910 [Muribaculaceae bacterium]|nr:hypothetical protein [Muribaculaceae bacterium]
MKIRLFVVSVLTILSAFCIEVYAQVLNRALEFSDSGYVDCGYLPEMEGKDSYSLQFWMKPFKWISGASIISYGDDFSVKLADPDQIIIHSGKKNLKVTSSELKPNEWTQVTIICNQGETEVLIDGSEAAKGNLSAITTNGSHPSFIIGGGFDGMIDEVRVWDDALNDEMKSFDYFTRNTLNKHNPMWSNLVAYYKMDQPDCPNLVEYKIIDSPDAEYNNHGIFYGDVKRVEADNPKLPYLINSAYTENPRFYYCVTPQDQYLLHNELIILGSDVYAEDGRIETKTPNNHAINFINTSYIPKFEGRNGILQLHGDKDSYFSIPAKTVKSDKNFTIEAWLYLDDINTDESSLPTKEWFHLAISSDEENQLGGISYYINGVKVDGENLNINLGASRDSENPDEILIGKDFKGKIDELVIWNEGFSLKDIKDHYEKGIPSPGYGYPVSREIMNAVGAYYKFDDENNQGHSYHSQDEWLNIMKKNYEGRQGIKYFISVQGTYRVRDKYGDWREILESSEKRHRFANDLAEISKNYDGAELDLEWIETPELWEHFGLLAQAIREAMPDDKQFRISLHNNFTAFPQDKMKYVDGFTFQQYGPQASNFSYQNFLDNVKKFEGLYEPKKIMTSYSTTTSRGSEGSPVRLIKGEPLNNYSPNYEDQDSFTIGEETWKFMGPMQVYRRAKQTREENLLGIFYWVIGDDNWNEENGDLKIAPNNQAKYSSFGINANNDPYIPSVKVNHPKNTESR